MNPSESSAVTPGQRLLAALTTQQTQILLGLVSQHGLLAGLDEKLRATDPDLADTVRRFLAAETPSQPVVAPSDQKALETWNDFWSDWESQLSELGDAEGAYANQEEHWHPPYFDSTALTDDLEKDARRLLEWLERALLEHADDWPAVLEAFAVFHRDGGAPTVAGELLAQWRERAVAACASYEEPSQKCADSWVYWLIEARRDPAAHQARLLEHLATWLDCCAESSAFFGKHWHSLALLTRSLPQAAQDHFDDDQGPSVRVEAGLDVGAAGLDTHAASPSRNYCLSLAAATC